MTMIHGWPIAFGRLSRAERGDYLRDGVTSAYRVIIEGVPGEFNAGFTTWVVCKRGSDWFVLDDDPLGHTGAPHRTRRGAVAAHIRSAQKYHYSPMFDLARRSTLADHCPRCDGYGDRLRQTNGEEGLCPHCHGTGVA